MKILLMKPLTEQGPYFKPDEKFLKQPVAQIKDRYIGAWFSPQQALEKLARGVK